MAQVEARPRSRPLQPPALPAFGDSHLARLIAAFDWSQSPLGVPSSWPQSLKTTVGLILPAAAQIVLFWGPDFVALYNDAYAPTIGDKHPRALGRPAHENWSELWDDLRPLLQRVRDTGETVSAKDRPFYIERYGYPETVYFDISYSAVPNEDGEVGGVLCIVSETTERINAEQALTALNETLESRVAEEVARRSRAEEVLRQAQKMETVGQLSGGIAHDFNNLLQVIHGNLSTLSRSLPAGEEKWRRFVSNALSGTERAAALTHRLLAFSRRQPLAPRPVDVNHLIIDMSELLHRTLGEPIEVVTHLEEAVPPALVDKNQLENAILNLAINARDAMPNGGRLDISTDLTGFPEDQQSSKSSPQFVRISVRDNGFGMSPEVLSRAVEPFFSTKEVGQGTGLGLSTVYGFAKQSGGHLLIQSDEGEGTSVDLLLPCADSAAEPATRSSGQSDLVTGRGERVLLCEDDPDVRYFSSETLRDLGYDVIEADSAASALAALKKQGRIDLLFTDVILRGGRTGADLAREARELQPDLKVLFTTGYARSALDGRSKEDTSIELLLKPFGVDELATKIRQILA